MMLVGELGSTATSGLTVITLIVVLAFAIDRITAGILFLLSFNTSWNKKFPEPILQETVSSRLAADKRQKLIYFILAASLAVLILFFADQVRVLSALGFQSSRPAAPMNAAAPAPTPSSESATTNTVNSTVTEDTTRSFRLLDFLVTALVLVGGADRIEQLLKRGAGGGSPSSEAKPLEIKGKITVEDESKKH